MHPRILTIISCLMIFMSMLKAQSPNESLIEITTERAHSLAALLALSPDETEKLAGIYVKAALAIEDQIVNAEPEVAMIREIHAIERTRLGEVKDLLDDNHFELYRHILEKEEARERSRFDSLQVYLEDEGLKAEILEYYDENVVPYLIYYHQTYLKPALKQKHYWQINEARQALYDYEELKEGDKEEMLYDAILSATISDLESQVENLKSVRKRYRDELDYITVALGPAERIWSEDYIALVKDHFPDPVYQKIKDYRHAMNAYGMEYILGELSMVLFDVWNPRSYIESRNTLLEVFEKSLR